MSFRIGFGHDIHQLTDNRDFWLGGIKIPYIKGALGHSDADVLIHAICDALLGAVNMRDIGFHFSDSSDEYKGIDSKILLHDVIEMLHTKGVEIVNIDSTICLQKPKISEFIPPMIYCLSQVMNIAEEDISIKATTTENLGFVGREEGISAYAVVLVKKNNI